MRTRFRGAEDFDRRFDRDNEREPGFAVRSYTPRNRLRPLPSRLFYTCCESWGACVCKEAA